MLRKIILLLAFLVPLVLTAQKNTLDSINRVIDKIRTDTGKIREKCDIAFNLRVNAPATALQLASEALALSKKIKYTDGQSKSLGTMAIIFRLLGNYPLALEYNLKRLKLVEKTGDREKLAGVFINTGFVYVNLEEYKNALNYYYKADSVLKKLDSALDKKFTVAQNLGDVYDKLHLNDSAFTYFTKSLTLARLEKDNYHEGMAMIGLGNNYLKTGQYLLATANYRSGITYLKEAADDDLLCEAYLGQASLYKKLDKPDSAVFYARESFILAAKDGFLPRQLDAAAFLSAHYQNEKDIDSSFLYMNHMQALNDSINSKSRIREAQVLSSSEQMRQIEIAENLQTARQERRQQLQLLFIAIFIPGFFLITLLLSRIKLHVRLVKILGVLSLLIFFEFLTLLLHPYVAEITHHTPVYEMLIFVSIAAILIPTHHRIEHRLIHWLTKNRPLTAGDKINLKRSKIVRKITE